MRNNYNIILGMALSFISISCLFLVIGIIIGEKIGRNNQISFPCRTVGVGLGTESASTSFLKKEFGNEYETIMAAAHRNGCQGESLLILFAIRKAENGRPGIEFGILCQAGTDLNTQAGWAATIMKNRKRWNGEEDFIAYLGSKYCPNDYVNWVHNVTYWYKKFKEKENEL